MATTLLKIAADLQTSLANAVSVGDTTATLTSATDEDGVALPSGKYGFTIDGDTSAKEYIVCDLVGTALTNIQNVSRQDAATTGFANYHRIGATVTITDWAILSRVVNNLDGTTGFDANVNLGYDGAPAGLTGNEFATVQYVLDTVSGGTVTFSQQVVSNQTAGENLTIRDHVYFKESDQKWWKVDTDDSATYTQVRRGIALATASVNTSVTIAISGPVTGFTGLTAGSKYYGSGTAGAIATSATDAPIGQAFSTTVLVIEPNFITIPTTNQKNAMAGGGDLGTPSSTNKFLTETGLSSTTYFPIPNVTVYSNIFGSSTTQFDITNPSGTTFRYTFDGTGTNPTISATTVPIGTTLVIAAQNFNAANNGTFVVTGSGSNYFEVTNASGVAESNVTLGTGTIKYGYAKPANLAYVFMEVVGGGGGGGGNTTNPQGAAGGGGGGYSKRLLVPGDLAAAETITIGAGGAGGAGTGANGSSGGTSSVGSLLSATGGAGGTQSGSGGAGGIGSGGDINIAGGGGGGAAATGGATGGGGSSYFGGGAPELGSSESAGVAGGVYGGGGGGGVSNGGDAAGGAGANGVVIVTEYLYYT